MPSRLDPAPTLTLDQVARALGVHYMTVYRYVRQGRLSATRVHGIWQVSRTALDEFRTSSSRTGSRAGRPTSGDARRRGNYVAELENCLVAGDGNGAWEVLQRALLAGADADEIYVEILSPALVSIGDRWARGELEIAVEHQATAIATRLVGRFGSHFSHPGRRRGVLLIGGPAGERHGLVLAMLGDLLRGRGWDVHDLGPDTPAQSFVHAARSISGLVAVGVSVSSNECLDSAEETVRALRAALGDAIPLVVGGHAVRDLAHAQALGADQWAEGADDFAAYVDRIRVE